LKLFAKLLPQESARATWKSFYSFIDALASPSRSQFDVIGL